MEKEFRITTENSGLRIDAVLGKLVEGISRSQIQKMFGRDCIFVNGEICKSKKYIVSEDDKILINLDDSFFSNDSKELSPRGEAIPLNITYEDDNYMVINKPKGLVVHPGNGNEGGTLVNGLIHYLGEGFLSEMEDVCDIERPGIVHRIDKDTTGLIVVAKTKDAYLSLSEQFKEHSITRKYTAIVYNNIKEDEGTVDAPIGRDSKNRLRRAVNGIEAKRAVTHYKVLERLGNYCHVEANLETGRTHQIRVHMAYIGHPVLGDPVYGPRKVIRGAAGQMLHAGVLGFLKLDGEYIEFTVDIPEEFQMMLSKLRKMVR